MGLVSQKFSLPYSSGPGCGLLELYNCDACSVAVSTHQGTYNLFVQKLEGEKQQTMMREFR
jgi:hypothetical protein